MTDKHEEIVRDIYDRRLNNEERIEMTITALRRIERETLERAARVCEQHDEDGEGPDCWDWHSKDYAKAIRALIKSEKVQEGE